MESPENDNVASKAGEISPARSLRRWQFTLAGLFTLTTLVAVAFSIASLLGWQTVGLLLLLFVGVGLLCVYALAPALAMTLWGFLRNRAPRLRFVVPGGCLVVIALPLAAFVATSAVNNHLDDALPVFGLLFYWAPQFYLWWAAAFGQEPGGRRQ